MISKYQISSSQLLFMSVGSALVFPYTFMPILNSSPSNQDVWIVFLMAVLFISVFSLPILFISNKFKAIPSYEVAETIAGKFFGKVINIFFILFFVYCFIACTLIMDSFIRLFVLPDTPKWVILLFMIIPAAYAAYKGAGTIGKISFFIVPSVIISVLIFFLLGIKDMKLDMLEPILADSTFLQLSEGAFFTGARYSEILIFFIFSFFLKKNASINKTYLSSLAVFGISFMLILLPVLLVLGSTLAKNSWNPYFVFTRQLQTYEFIKRVQSLNILVWFPCSVLKLAMYFFMGSYLFSGVCGAKSHKPFVFPLMILCFIICLIEVLNTSTIIQVFSADNFFPFITLPVIFILPVILIIIYLIRKKKVNGIMNKKAKSAQQ